MYQSRNEWVIHVWGKNRDTLELNEVEKFHIDMLKMFQPQQKKFDKILINIAIDDLNDTRVFNFLKEKISEVIVIKNVEFWMCQNDIELGEYVTFRPYVFDRIGEDVNVFYSHFKGYGTYVNIYKESYPRRIISLCEMFWSYIMYRYSLNMNDVQKNLKNKCVYCWFLSKNNTDEHVVGFYKKYQKYLQGDDGTFKDYLADDLCKHSPGSFLWYNLKNIGEELKDKPEVTSITTDYLRQHSKSGVIHLCTHFCEVYLMQFLKEDDCYSVKDYGEFMHNLTGTLYTQIYPQKIIGREFVKDFEKYLIEKRLI